MSTRTPPGPRDEKGPAWINDGWMVRGGRPRRRRSPLGVVEPKQPRNGIPAQGPVVIQVFIRNPAHCLLVALQSLSPPMDNISHVRSRSTSPSRSLRRAPPDPNRVFRACELCFKAKTKCDDVTEAGCSRCRARRKDCSLVQAISASRSERERSPLYPPRLREYDEAPPAPAWGRRSSGLVEQHDAQLRLMEDRVRYLEDRLLTMQLDLQHLGQSQQRQQNQLQHANMPPGNPLAQPQAHDPPSISLFDPVMPATMIPDNDPFSFLPSHASSSALDIPSNIATGSASLPTPAPAAGPKEEDFVKVYKRHLDRNCFNKSIEKGPAALVYDESCFRGVAMDDFPNVIKRGLFTQNQVDLAFHL